MNKSNYKDNYHLRVCSNCKHYSVFEDYDAGIISKCYGQEGVVPWGSGFCDLFVYSRNLNGTEDHYIVKRLAEIESICNDGIEWLIHKIQEYPEFSKFNPSVCYDENWNEIVFEWLDVKCSLIINIYDKKAYWHWVIDEKDELNGVKEKSLDLKHEKDWQWIIEEIKKNGIES